MSGPRKIWTPGEAVTTTELQRSADAAAGADDLVSTLIFRGAQGNGAVFGKQVGSLVLETSSRNPRLIVVPSGGTAGALTLRPCWITITDKDAGNRLVPPVLLSAYVDTDTDSPQFAATAANNRIDVLYALVQRTATTAARKVKDPTTGVVSTQTITIYTAPTVTLGVQPGVEAGSPTVPALPADSSSAWYVPLANVTLTHPYTLGSALTQAQVAPAWSPNWLIPSLVRGYLPYLLTPAASGFVQATTRTADGVWGQYGRIGMAVRWTNSAAGVGQLDKARDWRRRVVRVRTFLPPDEGGAPHHPPLQSATVPGALVADDSGQRFTGTTGANFYTFTTAGGTVFAFRANGGTGYLELQLSGNIIDGVNGDNYFIDVEFTDQFLA